MVPPLVYLHLTMQTSRCLTTPLAVSGDTVLPYCNFQKGHSGRYLGAASYCLAPNGSSLKEGKALTCSHHHVTQVS